MRAVLDAGDLVEAAHRYGTPLYVYDYGVVEERLRLVYSLLSRHRGENAAAFPLAHAPIADLARFLAEREAWFAASTAGEVEFLVRTGVNPGRVILGGPGKARWELRHAVSRRVYSVHVDTLGEIADLAEEAAAAGLVQRVGVEVNPGVEVGRRGRLPVTTRWFKLGVEPSTLLEAAAGIAGLDSVELVGLSAHVGPVNDASPYVSAAAVLLDVADKLAVDGVNIEYLDLGEPPPDPSAAASVLGAIADLVSESHPDMGLVVEPGLLLVSDACVLVSKVLAVKEVYGKRWAIIDAAATDYPAVLVSKEKPEVECLTCGDRPARLYSIGGPLPDGFDTFVGGVLLPELGRGDLVAVRRAGAYGWALSSNYRSRPRPPVVRLYMGEERAVAVRETMDELMERQLIHG